ncbi:UDP-N-acetylmuramoyl-L-alanyl-D-glutamate--2,6-diaminopimelate ligase [Chryseomicrobium sp. FSL W7-1435]|uniref:UDP-N-acetylmuramoyl-L-alanyl-D-glutamate--2, 6-diaminopimelate ligase n=1 Tax=Chryseomicrobium sp. FSL W7-1435 TaxID=2921704 RepID=UPI003159F4DE
MYLHDLLETVPTQDPLPTIKVEGIETNSKRVKAGDVFFALTGHTTDGHDYIEAAIKAGAVAVVGTEPMEFEAVPYIQVADSRKTVAFAAKTFYGNPSHQKTVIGITGTNGKTTTSFLLKGMLEGLGYSCALFGTVHYVINGETLPSPNTTPDSLQFQRLLHESKDDVVLMEVSSHGIDQLRIEGIDFDYTVFTNLDHDHLDYHHTMEEYFAVKSKLFHQLKATGTAVVCTLDSWGVRLVNQLVGDNIPMKTVGVLPESDTLLSEDYYSISMGQEQIQLPLDMPRHNRINAALAATVIKEMGGSLAQVEQELTTFSGVPGRFEVVEGPEDIRIVIDYAHTADAFRQVLESARQLSTGRILHVFGFRGKRDATKRPEMIRVSTQHSDHSILTFDDLNGLTAEQMTHQLDELEFTGERINDRTRAIERAISQARSGDWIVITGKGSESYQEDFELHTTTDAETVALVLRSLKLSC